MGNNGFFRIPTFSGYISQNSRTATAIFIFKAVKIVHLQKYFYFADKTLRHWIKQSNHSGTNGLSVVSEKQMYSQSLNSQLFKRFNTECANLYCQFKYNHS